MKTQAQRDKLAKSLAGMEAKLREFDQADDQLGEHATDAERRTLREMERLRQSGEATTDQGQTRYLYLTRQLREARVARSMAAEARKRRGP